MARRKIIQDSYSDQQCVMVLLKPAWSIEPCKKSHTILPLNHSEGVCFALFGSVILPFKSFDWFTYPYSILCVGKEISILQKKIDCKMLNKMSASGDRLDIQVMSYQYGDSRHKGKAVSLAVNTSLNFITCNLNLMPRNVIFSVA